VSSHLVLPLRTLEDIRTLEDMSPRNPQANKSSGEPANPKQKRLRTAASRRLIQWGPFRRWYVRRTLRFIDRSKAKGRPLPEGMVETARQLGRVPKQRRAQVLEDAILAQREMPETGRELRRAAARQRLSTRSDTRYRQGRPPGASQQSRPRPR
jgi:hypothetical protein